MSYDNPRIKSLNMTFTDVMVEMSEGNPGALSVMVMLVENAEKVDPDSAIGWFGPISGLDNLDCYGSRIWLLYKDVCKQDIIKVLAVLRANQLGILSDHQINAAIDGSAPINPAEILGKVQERLPQFADQKGGDKAA